MNPIEKKFKNLDIIMASRSSRRHAILRQLDIQFRIAPLDVEESYPADLAVEKVAEYISNIKVEAFPEDRMKDNSIVISADTVVIVNDTILGKPKDEAEAKTMLQMLSGSSHQVITGVSLRSKTKKTSFSSLTQVRFKELTEEEIDYYIYEYQPFDKAGAYGIQEWIGKIGVEWIEGSFYNVMGLPIQMLYKEMCKFTS